MEPTSVQKLANGHIIEYNDSRGTSRQVILDFDDKTGHSGICERIQQGVQNYRNKTSKKAHYVMIDHPSYIALRFMLHKEHGRENEPVDLFGGVRVLVNFEAQEPSMVFGCKPGLDM